MDVLILGSGYHEIEILDCPVREFSTTVASLKLV
jgi:hypothetical protein